MSELNIIICHCSFLWNLHTKSHRWMDLFRIHKLEKFTKWASSCHSLFFKKNWRTSVLSVAHCYPCFWNSGGVDPGFQNQGGSHAWLPRCNGFLRFTSDATPGDLLRDTIVLLTLMYSGGREGGSSDLHLRKIILNSCKVHWKYEPLMKFQRSFNDLLNQFFTTYDSLQHILQKLSQYGIRMSIINNG